MKPFCLVATLALVSCVTYSPLSGDPATIAAELRDRPGGRYDWPAAVELAFQQNARLQALAARARAAGLNLSPSDTQSEYRSQGEMLALMADPVSLLNQGQRGTANATLQAEAAAAAQELAVARWEVATAIAEGFAVAAVYAELPPPLPLAPVEEFSNAGLASRRAAQSVLSAILRQETELRRRQILQQANLVQLRELLGLASEATLELDGLPLFRPNKQDGQTALLHRPDIALATARFQVADAALRQAIAGQYPSLMIGPEIPLLGGPLQMMAILRLPLGAASAARAAEASREVARADLAAALLSADREAKALALERDSTRLLAESAVANAGSSRASYTAALLATELEVDAFDRVADTMAMAVRDLIEIREALEAAARATMRSSFAHGWPALENHR